MTTHEHPTIPSSREGPDARAFERDVANRLLEERVVTLSGKLDETTANDVTGQLILLGRDSRHEPVTLRLSCNDSDLGPSLALADAVELTPAPVHAVVHGTLRGPAVAVLCAAAGRAAHCHALFVLSLPDAPAQGTAGGTAQGTAGGTAEGTAAQVASLAQQHVHQVEQLRQRIAEATGRRADDVTADLEGGRLMSAGEARDYGLVGEIL